jgi:prepilin-type N-terminal cleavage/methylation domain-containing protein
MSRRLGHLSKGFTLVEVVVTMLLASIIMLTAGVFIIEGTGLTKRLEQSGQASVLADTLLTEVLYVIKEADCIAADGGLLAFSGGAYNEEASLGSDSEGYISLESGQGRQLLLPEAAYGGLKAELENLRTEEGSLGTEVRGTLVIRAGDRVLKSLDFTLNPEIG